MLLVFKLVLLLIVLGYRYPFSFYFHGLLEPFMVKGLTYLNPKIPSNSVEIHSPGLQTIHWNISRNGDHIYRIHLGQGSCAAEVLI